MKYLVVLSALTGLAFASNQHINDGIFTFPLDKNAYGSPKVRIVGGQQASPNQFPYQVGLFINRQLTETFCGGSLISKNYVLTAAHCAEGAISIDVELGAHNISDKSESTKQIQTSTNYVVHAGWDSSLLVNDIAVIKLPKPAELNSFVQLVKLASGDDTYVNDQGVISGWGKTNDDDNGVTDILRFVNNTILSNSQCQAVNEDYANIIQSTHLCLSGEGNKGTCQGDSGGPLVAKGVQVGISSFNYKSCVASKPSVLTRVTKYLQWIKDNSDVSF